MSTPETVPVSVPVPVSVEQTVAEKLFQLLVDGIQKKPETVSEAIALVEYIYHKDLAPLLAKLRVWALSELENKEAAIAQATWSEVKAVEEKLKGWCVPRA